MIDKTTYTRWYCYYTRSCCLFFIVGQSFFRFWPECKSRRGDPLACLSHLTISQVYIYWLSILSTVSRVSGLFSFAEWNPLLPKDSQTIRRVRTFSLSELCFFDVNPIWLSQGRMTHETSAFYPCIHPRVLANWQLNDTILYANLYRSPDRVDVRNFSGSESKGRELTYIQAVLWLCGWARRRRRISFDCGCGIVCESWNESSHDDTI